MSESPQSDLHEASIELVTLDLDRVVPYWRNPRKISNEAVNAVAESIKRYGYQQPIVVDEEHTIIIGHTRYAALRRLGYTSVPVRVERDLSARKVKQLRTFDNRTAEYTLWDYDKLVDELEKLEHTAVNDFFEDVLPSTDELEVDLGGNDEEEDPEISPVEQAEAAEFICPGCYHSWEKVVTEKDIRKGRIEGETR